VVVVPFDVDGTLVDSAEPILTALNDALVDNALPPVSADELWKIVGPPIHQALQSVMKDWGENTDLVPKLVSDYGTLPAAGATLP
jgi:phosphoglycolate phosphatase-like HAD superfamily hydrolase